MNVKIDIVTSFLGAVSQQHFKSVDHDDSETKGSEFLGGENRRA